jgi:uncharacterized RDD family membrane protein YckC
MKGKNFIKPDIGAGSRAARLMRVLAKAIDFFLAFLLCVVLYPFGVLLSIGYLCIADSLNQGESVGKKLMGFKVLCLKEGKPCSFKASTVRNLPFTVPLLFLLVPVWGWLACFFSLIPLLVLEIFLIFKLDAFHRLGDVMADTTVIANDPHREFYKKKDKKEWIAGQSSVTTHRAQKMDF